MDRRKKRKGFFGKYYGDSWSFIKDSRNFIYAAIILFVVSTLIGFIFPVLFEEQILGFLEDLILETEGKGVLEMIIFLFLNNIQSAFFGMIFGVFIGIFSIFNAIVNGYVLGFVANKVVAVEGIFVLWRILPHGIFELPALFLSLGLGLKMGSFVFQKRAWRSLKEYFIKSLLTFLLVIVPLLIIAAIIEGILIVGIG